MTGIQTHEGMSVEEMRAYYVKDDAPPQRWQAWGRRCANYYGAKGIEHVATWQRESYERVTRDKEPRG